MDSSNDYKRILQSDWMQSTPGKTQPKLIVSYVIYSIQKNLRYLILQQCCNKRILQSNWTKSTPDYTKPKVIVSDVSFSWWLSPCKKTKTSIDSFQRYWWSKNPQQSNKFAILKSSDFSRFSWQNVKNLTDFLIILTLENDQRIPSNHASLQFWNRLTFPGFPGKM